LVYYYQFTNYRHTMEVEEFDEKPDPVELEDEEEVLLDDEL
jgi:hypothetical protein